MVLRVVNYCRRMTGLGMGKWYTDEARLAKDMECFKNAHN